VNISQSVNMPLFQRVSRRVVTVTTMMLSLKQENTTEQSKRHNVDEISKLKW